MQKTAILFLSIILCTACKTTKLAKQGYVPKTNYLDTIPFELINNFSVVKVEIEGETYDFIYDTGADLNVIDEKVIKKISHSKITSGKVRGSAQRKRKQSYVKVPILKLGASEFKDMGVIVMNLDGLNTALGCLHIDGLIGSNLMRQTYWQINYDSTEMYIADDFSRLPVATTASMIDLNCGKTGAPILKMELDGVNYKLKMDTGFNAEFKVPSKLLEKLKKNKPNLKTARQNSTLGGSVFGTFKTSTEVVLLDTIKLGAIEVNQQLISCSPNTGGLLGNAFFKNFLISMDWEKEILYLSQTTPIKKDTLSVLEYPIQLDFLKNQFIIGGAWEGHAHKEAFPFGTEVTQIEGIQVDTFSRTQVCDFLKSDPYNELIDQDTININIIHKDRAQEVLLTRKVLLPGNK